jgi:hypothetical protein
MATSRRGGLRRWSEAYVPIFLSILSLGISVAAAYWTWFSDVLAKREEIVGAPSMGIQRVIEATLQRGWPGTASPA